MNIPLKLSDSDIEKAYHRLRKGIKLLVDLALVFKKIETRGTGNFVVKGPNIIVGNHCGSFKDVGLLLRLVPRRIFFTANKMIFSREDFSELVHRHLKRHLSQFGVFLHLILNPYYSFVVQYISSNISSVGTIPVNIYGSKRDAIVICQDYLKQGRAIIALQGRGRVHPGDPNPYIREFRRGVSVMAYNLQNEGIPVPVTPISFFGTHYPWAVPAKIKVNVGKPLYISDFWTGNEQATIEKFRQALQQKVSSLFLESLKWQPGS